MQYMAALQCGVVGATACHLIDARWWTCRSLSAPPRQALDRRLRSPGESSSCVGVDKTKSAKSLRTDVENRPLTSAQALFALVQLTVLAAAGS